MEEEVPSLKHLAEAYNLIPPPGSALLGVGTELSELPCIKRELDNGLFSQISTAETAPSEEELESPKIAWRDEIQRKNASSRQECSAEFTSTNDAASHVKNHAEEAAFASKHISNKAHEGRKRFPCSECEKTFPSAYALRRHERSHTGEKPYRCKECGKSFSQSCHLDTHFRIHSGEKPYQCKECGLCFTRTNLLNSHIRIHTGEKKPYQCKECGKYFSQSSNLKDHYRVHTGEKPFRCQKCGKSYSRYYNLKKHYKNHMGGTSGICVWSEEKGTHVPLILNENPLESQS